MITPLQERIERMVAGCHIPLEIPGIEQYISIKKDEATEVDVQEALLAMDLHCAKPDTLRWGTYSAVISALRTRFADAGIPLSVIGDANGFKCAYDSTRVLMEMQSLGNEFGALKRAYADKQKTFCLLDE